MPLDVKLRDGFKDDSVVITADGKEVYRKRHVTTDLTISFADAFQLPGEQESVVLAVAVEGGPRAEQLVRPRVTPFVEIWRQEGRLDLRAAHEETPLL